MITGWKNQAAKEAFEGRTPKGFSAQVAKAARRRLAQLNAAAKVEDMRTPPGNKLHKVGDDWSVWVNDQFRVTFKWGPQGPYDVWLGDYH